MKIALLCNPRPCGVCVGEPDDAYEEYDTAETIEAIGAALRASGRSVEPVVADAQLPRRLSEGRYDFAFNIAEGARGRRCREAMSAAVCELLSLPYTGSDMLTLALTLDKALARRAVTPEVRVARAVLVESPADYRRVHELDYPVLVKPNDEGSSKGIRDHPIAADPEAAAARCEWLQRRYGCPVLVEEFLAGPEVTVGIAGNGAEADLLGMMEIAPAIPDGPFVYSLEMKRDWARRVRYHQPPRLSAEAILEIERSALNAYRLLGCRDLARLDFRLDASGRPHFLECNPLPGLNPQSGDIVILSKPKLCYEELICGVLEHALARAPSVRRPCPRISTPSRDESADPLLPAAR